MVQIKRAEMTTLIPVQSKNTPKLVAYCNSVPSLDRIEPARKYSKWDTKWDVQNLSTKDAVPKQSLQGNGRTRHRHGGDTVLWAAVDQSV